MKNLYLRQRIADQIDDQVEKVLRDLGYPEPPLKLDIVRDQLKLDLKYYGSEKDGFLNEVIHRAKLGAQQIANAPVAFWSAIKKWDLKAMFFPDRKQILLDETVPSIKWRWSEAHEIVHSVLSWHQHLMPVDSSLTLSPGCSFKMEAEANYGAGRLLFLQNRFVAEALSSPADWKHIQRLSKTYGNTLTSTLWRLVEILSIPAVGIVCKHPRFRDDDYDPNEPLKYFIRSLEFEKKFSSFTEFDAMAVFESYCRRSRGGPLGSKVALIKDDNGEEHEFLFESFSNTHEALTLATYVRKYPAIIGT
jgi:Zn-dependent peptidase ImmA (M78 family)